MSTGRRETKRDATNRKSKLPANLLLKIARGNHYLAREFPDDIGENKPINFKFFMSGDYRIARAEIDSLSSFEIVHKFVFATSANLPCSCYQNDCRDFLSNLDPTIAQLYSSYFAADAIVQGGEWQIFENFCGSMVKCAIEGFQMFGKNVQADKLLEACKFFPGDLDFLDPAVYLDENRDDWFKFIATHDTKIQIDTITDFFDYDKFINSNLSLIVKD